jgi:NhaP-type Na+/H+ and K+/H+ antiporter
VVRDGRLLRPRELDRLDPGDSVLVIAPSSQATVLDELFAGRPSQQSATSFGEFTFDGDLRLGKLAEFYDLPVPEEDRAMTLADQVQARLGRKPLIGDRIRLGHIELIVQGVRGERITEVAIELEPRARASLSPARLRALLRHALVRLRRRLVSRRKGRRERRRPEPSVARDLEPGRREPE